MLNIIYLNIRYTASDIDISSILIYNIDIYMTSGHIFSGKHGHTCTSLAKQNPESKILKSRHIFYRVKRVKKGKLKDLKKCINSITLTSFYSKFLPIEIVSD
jgi:hypothetical protein